LRGAQADGRRFFLFSSRRRHTRCLSDWSSDVCSSDLVKIAERRVEEQNLLAELGRAKAQDQVDAQNDLVSSKNQRTQALVGHTRSEERRVGKECRCRGWAVREALGQRRGGGGWGLRLQ